ncbi:MAG TPA: DUF47 domain-containing protein [Azospirillum sp.]|nr:DUF47 domain-containing protein [Azospirillum sp.]
MFLRLFRVLMPREEKFIDYFGEHSEKIMEAAAALHDLLGHEGDRQAAFQRILDAEHAADQITKNTLLAIHRTFITPFDRSDIHALITAMDDTIDFIEEAAQRIMIYGITEFTPEMRQMADAAMQCARLLREGVPLLGSVGKNLMHLQRMSVEISRIEGETDALMRSCLSRLHASESDPKRFIIIKEIYELLEEIVDHCDDVSNVVDGIVVEQV